MKKFSKLFWVALVVVAVLACTAIGVFAAETVSTAVVYGEVVEATESFSVDFSFKNNNTKVECGKITLTWDSELMTAEDIVKVDALADAQFGFNIENGKAVIAWAGSAITKETAEGKLFTVNFAKTGIADTGYATVDIAVDNFGYTEGFVAKELKSTVQENDVFATTSEFDGMTYDEKTTKSPAEFLEEALGLAAQTGEDVNVLVASEMEFTESVKIGEETYNENAGTVYVYADMVDGVPAAGIRIYANAIVDFYGNVNFNNILIGNTQYKYGVTLPPTVEEFNAGTGKQGGTSGGCFQFTQGMGTFGHANTGTEEAPDYGFINIYPDENVYQLNADGTAVERVSKKCSMHLAGHVTVYSGTYWTVTGNYFGSDVTVDSPYLKVAGDASVYNVYGGVYYSSKNPITGTPEIIIEDAADVTSGLYGGSYYAKGEVHGANITIDTTGNIPTFYLSSYNANVDEDFKNLEYKVTIKNGNFKGSIYGYRAQAGTAKNCNFVFDIQGGTFEGLLFTGINTTNTMSSIAIEGKVDLDISGGLFTNNTYLGSYLNYDFKTEPEKSHQAMDRLVRDIDITGGQFNANMYFGSYIKAPNKSRHEGATDITITNGIFKNGIHAGSLFAGSDGEHKGAITMTLQGTTGKLINVTGGHVAGGSGFGYTYTGFDGATEICQRNYHTGDTTVYLKDIVFLSASDTTLGLTNNLYVKNKFFAGSSLNGVTGSAENRNEHKGNSKLVIQRSALGDMNMRFYGGSRIDGDYNVHSGTSTLEVDANTGWDSVNNVETPNVGGWARITDVIFGGCLLNGSIASDYAANTDVTSATSQVKQLGKSELRLIAPADRDSTQYTHKLDINNRRAIGGAYHADNVKTRPTYDSEIYIENVVDSTGNQRINAGPYYNTMLFSETTVERVPTSRVVLNGTYNSSISLGGEVNCASSQDYLINTAVVFMANGNCASSKLNLGPTNCSTTKTSGFIKHKGSRFIEVHAGTPVFADGASFQLSGPNVVSHSGDTAAKFVGAFNDTTGDNKYTVYSFFYAKYLDISQETAGKNFEYYQLKYNANVAGNWEKINKNNYNTGNLMERINSSKIIKFVEAGATTTAYTEIKVKPGMKFADLLATEGMMFYTNFSSGTYPRVLSYATETMFDSASESPNAFEFYLADATGKPIGEALKTVPADRDQAIVVKVGNVYTKASLLSYEGVEVNGTVTNAESAVTVQLIKDEKVAYEATVEPTEGSAAYAIDFVTEGTYTLKVTSEGRVPYTGEIIVAAENVTKDVELVEPVLDVTFLHNCSFGNSFSLLYAVTQSSLDGYSNIRLVVEKDVYTGNTLTGTETTTLTPKDYTKSGVLYHRFDFTGVTARMLGDGIRATLKAEKDGIVYESAVDEYNLVDYAHTVLGKSSTKESLKRVLVDALNYCAAAQTRNSYRTDALVNANLTDEQKALSTGVYDALTKHETTTRLETGKTVNSIMKNVKFGNSIEAIFAMDLSVYGEDFSGIVLNVQYLNSSNDLTTVEVTSDKFIYNNSIGMYYGSIDTLKASEMRSVMTVKVMHNGVQVSDTITYSIEDYVATQIEKGSNAKLIALLEAMMVYSDSAAAHFSN